MRTIYRYPLEPQFAPTDEVGDGAAAFDDEPDEQMEDYAPSSGEGYTVAVQMPSDAEILDVKLSSKGLLLYALVDPEADKAAREFFVVGNGRPVHEGVRTEGYVGTAKVVGGRTAHVFELVPVAA